MVLHIDPRFRLVWRSPDSLQFGVDDPPVTLYDVTEAQERMIAALAVGISGPGLSMLAHSAGADAGEPERLLRQLDPILLVETPKPRPRPRTIVIAGHGATVDRMADVLVACGMTPRLVGRNIPAAAEALGVAVVIAHFVVDPAFHGLWLRRDVPHLPLVFGDSGARIGPLVEPGTGPCLHCLERWHTDEDPAWPAIASQLLGRRSPIDEGLVAGEVAAIAVRLLLARLAYGPGDSAESVWVDAVSGSTERTLWRRHPQCGCEALPGIGTADVESSASAQPRPTTDEAVHARA